MNRILTWLVFLIFLLAPLMGRATDPLFHRQWALENTGQQILLETGELTRTAVEGVPGEDIDWMNELEIEEYAKKNQLQVAEGPVIVAVIDSGLDIDHPELAGRVWFNHKLCDSLSTEERQNQPCRGWNFLDGTADLTDDIGHGTHVAGLIAANGDGRGIIGAAPRSVQIMPLKVLNKDVNGFTYKNKLITNIIADAISFAVQNGAHVINLSLGWPELIHVPRIIFAIQRAQELGVLVVAATGNNNKDIPTYPCIMEGVLCVGASDNRGELTEFSNFSGKVDLVAPGEDIVSLYPRQLESRTLRIQGLETKRGSSQAAPYVAATAAVLKYLYPQSTVAELKARLLLSSQTRVQGSKRIKYGRLSMRGAVELSPQYFIEPDYKNILEITVTPTNQFELALPLQNYLGALQDIQIEVQLSHEQIKLEQTQFVLEHLDEGERHIIQLKGTLELPSLDTDHLLKVSIQAGEITHTSQTRVVFSRYVDLEQTQKVTLPPLHPNMISVFNGPQKISRMRRILRPQGGEKLQLDWFFQGPQSGESTVQILSLFENSSNGTMLRLGERVNQVLGVFMVDINQDGEDNIVVYSIDEQRQNLLLHLFSLEGDLVTSLPHRWIFPITAFEGLPLTARGEDFVWLKHQHPSYGDLLVPAFKRRWTLPEEDNTRDLLARLPDGEQERLYALIPEENEQQEFVLKIRSLESYTFQRSLEELARLRELETILLSRPFDQTLSERANGQFRTLLLIGREARKRAYWLVWNSTSDWELSPIAIGVHSLDGNLMHRLLELQSGEASGRLGAMALISREHARLLSLDPRQGEMSRIEIKNPSYGDPFFAFLGGVQLGDGEVVHFLESRHSMQVHSSQHGTMTLPINRESSFPGMNFSEMFALLFIEREQGGVLPGLSVNATQVIGDRLYTMVYHDGQFTRPIDLSFTLPKNCLPLGATRIQSQSRLSLLCKDESRPLMGQMFVVHLPLKTAL